MVNSHIELEKGHCWLVKFVILKSMYLMYFSGQKNLYAVYASPVMTPSALFGPVKNDDHQRCWANRNWAGPPDPGPAHQTG